MDYTIWSPRELIERIHELEAQQCKHKNNAVAMMIAQQNSKEHVN